MATTVTITGTGVPISAPGRAGAGVLVRTDDLALQFDAGRATTLRLAEAGSPASRLDAVFLTHHHSDHLTGLVDVVFTHWLERPTDHTPLPVVAPEGPAADYVRAMLGPWQDDIELRREHVGRVDRPDPDVVAFAATAEPSVVWSSGDVVVEAVTVHHEPVQPAVAFRVTTADGVVVVSGDTRVCAEVEALATGVDVLVHEAWQAAAVQPFYDVLPHLAALAGYHADTRELGGLVARAEPKVVVLTHLIPAPGDEAARQAFADDLRAEGFAGEVVVADDLTTVTF